MYGFTIVLKKKNHSSVKGFKSVNQGRRKSYRRRKPLRISKFVPIFFLMLTLSVAVAVSKLGDGNEYKEVDSPKDNLSETESDYEFYYNPIVINDIEEYDEQSVNATDGMITACCWSLIEENGKGKYECFGNKSIIPSEDVEERLHELFGDKMKIENRTVKSGETEFVFSDGSYYVPITGFVPLYFPKLIDVKEDKEGVILTVGCMKSTDYLQNSKGKMVEPEVSKKLKIWLKKENNKEYIRKVEIKC